MFTKNWKTTLVGFVMAFANLLAAGLTTGISFKDAAISAAIAAIGIVAKDYDTSGNGGFGGVATKQ